MTHSLRLRLLLMTFLVSGVAIAAVALLSSRLTSRQFNLYLASNNETNLERFREVLTKYYQDRGNWIEVQSALDRLGQIAGKGLILVDNGRQVLAATPPKLVRASIEVTSDHQVSFEWRETTPAPQSESSNNARSMRVEERVEKGMLRGTPHVFILDARGNIAGTLYVVPVNMRGPEGSRESVFVGAVNRSFIIAGLIAAAAALLVTLLLSRRILGPIEALTSAVRNMENGDLSQRVNVQSKDEIGELAHAFNAMADGLARTEQLRRNMVSDIAHELRSPLTNLRCQIEALQDGLTAPSVGVFHSLHEEAMLLKTLIDDLQDLALAEAGQLRLEREPVSLAEAVRQAVSACSAQAEGKGITLKIAVPPNLPTVYADAKRVGQILRNLLANAIAHTPSGGAVEVCARAVGASVELTVSDTGAGIEPEHLPNIFERFYRADSSRARATGGAGLGLAIVKQLTEAMGGSVHAVSELGNGASFLVTLPCAEAAAMRSQH